MAKRKLNKVDLCYIEHNAGKLTVEQLAKDLGATQKAIIDALENLPVPAAPTPPTLPDIPAEKTVTGAAAPAAIPQTNQERGVTVMTPAASQYADEVAQRLPQADYLERNKDFIHRPR